jgi:hypothetical protein
MIDDYNVKTRRIGKFHYKVEVDLDLRQQQADWMLRDTLVRMFKRIWRWYDEWGKGEEGPCENNVGSGVERGFDGLDEREHEELASNAWDDAKDDAT